MNEIKFSRSNRHNGMFPDHQRQKWVPEPNKMGEMCRLATNKIRLIFPDGVFSFRTMSIL